MSGNANIGRDESSLAVSACGQLRPVHTACQAPRLGVCRGQAQCGGPSTKQGKILQGFLLPKQQ